MVGIPQEQSPRIDLLFERVLWWCMGTGMNYVRMQGPLLTIRRIFLGGYSRREANFYMHVNAISCTPASIVVPVTCEMLHRKRSTVWIEIFGPRSLHGRPSLIVQTP